MKKKPKPSDVVMPAPIGPEPSKDKSPEWEQVYGSGPDRLERYWVPGGWIYRSKGVSGTSVAFMALVFVPAEKAQGWPFQQQQEWGGWPPWLGLGMR